MSESCIIFPKEISSATPDNKASLLRSCDTNTAIPSPRSFCLKTRPLSLSQTRTLSEVLPNHILAEISINKIPSIAREIDHPLCHQNTQMSHCLNKQAESCCSVDSSYSNNIKINHPLSPGNALYKDSKFDSPSTSQDDKGHLSQFVRSEKNSQVSIASDSTASSPDANLKATLLQFLIPRQLSQDKVEIIKHECPISDKSHSRISDFIPQKDATGVSENTPKGAHSRDTSSFSNVTSNPTSICCRKSMRQHSLPVGPIYNTAGITDLAFRQINEFKKESSQSTNMLPCQAVAEHEDVDDHLFHNRTTSLKKAWRKASTPKADEHLQTGYTFQSPSSGTVLNRARHPEELNATETLRAMMDSLSHQYGNALDQSNQPSTPPQREKSKVPKRHLNVKFSNVVSKQSPDMDLSYIDQENQQKDVDLIQDPLASSIMYFENNKGMFLESFLYSLEDNQMSNGAATAPAAMMLDADTILANMVNSFGTENGFSKAYSGSQQSAKHQDVSPTSPFKKSLALQNSGSSGCNNISLTVFSDENYEDQFEKKSPATSNFNQENVEDYSTSYQQFLAPTHTEDNRQYMQNIRVENPYNQNPSNMCASCSSTMRPGMYNKSYECPIQKDLGFQKYPIPTYDQNYLAYVNQPEISPLYSNQYLRTNNSSYANSHFTDRMTGIPAYVDHYKLQHAHPAMVSGSAGICEHQMRENKKLYADDRDRMIYVSWIPKRARAYSDTDKRRMELELKHRLREQLNLDGLIKVLLFPPKGVHCKLIFNTRNAAGAFMDEYGGDTRSHATEKWKKDLCRIYDIDMRDKFDKTVVKIEWSQK